MWMVLVCCVAQTAAPAQAQDPEVNRALQRYRALDYEAAIPLLERALDRPGLAAQDRMLALAYLGRAHAVLRDQPAAVDAFAALLALDPAYDVAAIESPWIRDALAQARARARPAAPAIEKPPARAAVPEPPASSTSEAPPSIVPPGAGPATDVEPAPADAAPDASDGTGTALLYTGGALGLGLVLAGAAALAAWQLWPAPPTDANLGTWELP